MLESRIIEPTISKEIQQLLRNLSSLEISPLLLFEVLYNNLQKDSNLLPLSKELLFHPTRFYCVNKVLIRDAKRPPWIDREILQLIRKKNRIWHKAKLKDFVNGQILEVLSLV